VASTFLEEVNSNQVLIIESEVQHWEDNQADEAISLMTQHVLKEICGSEMDKLSQIQRLGLTSVFFLDNGASDLLTDRGANKRRLRESAEIQVTNKF